MKKCIQYKSQIFNILLFTLLCLNSCGSNIGEQKKQTKPTLTAGKPKYVRGIHLSAAAAGAPEFRKRFQYLLDKEKLNTIVIAIKEYDGIICLPNAKIAEKYNIPIRPIPKLKDFITELKQKGVYPIARIVVFKDNLLPRREPRFGIKTPDGNLWTDYKGVCWADPYNSEVWQYIIEIAKSAVEIGFEEIQFDYIRFPSDGNTKLCRYSQKHSSLTATAALVEFLKLAKEQLSPIPISIDVFGLTPSVTHDMGIGQRFLQMAEVVDFISPMVYPSHYAKGEYGIADPNKEPYKTVYRTVSDAKKLLGEKVYKLRPYLQDFSLGYKYGPQEVKAQIKACYDNGVFEWLLWDPKCKYTLEAIEEMTKFTPENYIIEKSTSTKIP